MGKGRVREGGIGLNGVGIASLAGANVIGVDMVRSKFADATHLRESNCCQSLDRQGYPEGGHAGFLIANLTLEYRLEHGSKPTDSENRIDGQWHPCIPHDVIGKQGVLR